MIVHRFMGQQEYDTLMKGKPLRNSVDHSDKRGDATCCKGFCFFTEDPDDAVHWLSGIVDLNWCVTFEVPENYLNEGWGMYYDEEKSNFSAIHRKRRKEYWRITYNSSKAKILGATNKYYSMYPTREQQKALMQGLGIAFL